MCATPDGVATFPPLCLEPLGLHLSNTLPFLVSFWVFLSTPHNSLPMLCSGSNLAVHLAKDSTVPRFIATCWIIHPLDILYVEPLQWEVCGGEYLRQVGHSSPANTWPSQDCLRLALNSPMGSFSSIAWHFLRESSPVCWNLLWLDKFFCVLVTFCYSNKHP